MRAGTAAGWCLVAPAAGRTLLHRRGTHACKQYTQVRDTGKQRVYTMQLSAWPSYLYTAGNK